MGDVAEIGSRLVVAPVRVIVRPPPAAQVRAQHPPLSREPVREEVEITGVSEKPTKAEQRHCGRARIAVAAKIEADAVLSGETLLAIRHRLSS